LRTRGERKTSDLQGREENEKKNEIVNVVNDTNSFQTGIEIIFNNQWRICHHTEIVCRALGKPEIGEREKEYKRDCTRNPQPPIASVSNVPNELWI